MNSPTPASGGDTRFSSDFLSHDGFPSILWEVLNSAGYPTPPLYTVQLYEEHRVPRCRVWLTLEAHPLQPGWHSLDSETIGFRTDDTTEAAAMKTLTTFCGYHPLEMVMHPLGLFPAESAFISFVSFGDLDNNTFKGLTSLLSVEQEIQYDEHT
jgi:hypothetical protein